MLAHIVAVLLATLCGCLPGGSGGSGGSGDAGTPSLAVELGTGERTFEPLADGDALPLIAGSQGGHHVWASFRIDGATPGLVAMTMDVQLVGLGDGALEGRGRVRTVAVDGAAQYAGWPARLALPHCAGDYPLRLDVTVVDEEGHWGSDTRTVTVRPGDIPGSGCEAAR